MAGHGWPRVAGLGLFPQPRPCRVTRHLAEPPSLSSSTTPQLQLQLQLHHSLLNLLLFPSPSPSLSSPSTMKCQKCRSPIKLHGSLEDLSPAAFNLLVGKSPPPQTIHIHANLTLTEHRLMNFTRDHHKLHYCTRLLPTILKAPLPPRPSRNI